jgi:hypothetical protein
MNTNDFEYKTIKTLRTNCIKYGFIGLWPCPAERGKIRYSLLFHMEGLCKGKRNSELCVKDRRSKTGHYVNPMGKVSEIPPPPPPHAPPRHRG